MIFLFFTFILTHTTVYVEARCFWVLLACVTIPKHLKLLQCPMCYGIKTCFDWPISIISVVSKPIEKHVHKHLSGFFESNQLLYSLQSGFRVKHSCHTSLSYLTNTWLTSLNKGEMTGTLFLDLSKAFDLVNHELLIKKLSAYHITNNSLAFLSPIYLIEVSMFLWMENLHPKVL